MDVVLIVVFSSGLGLFFVLNALLKQTDKSWLLLFISVSLLAAAVLFWRDPKFLGDLLYGARHGGTISHAQRPFWRIIGILFFGVSGIACLLVSFTSIVKKIFGKRS